MRYCVNCGSEYEDGITECADCPGQALVDAPPPRPRGSRPHGEYDTREFVRAGSADDPLTAEDYVRLLEEQSIPVISRARRSGTVDALTTGLVQGWWELLVPKEHAQRASALLSQEKALLESTSEEAARAAEEEEREGEASAPRSP